MRHLQLSTSDGTACAKVAPQGFVGVVGPLVAHRHLPPPPVRYQLPPLPEVASQAMLLASRPNANATDVAHAMEADPRLADRVLQISNSVVYAGREPARTLQAAILRLGFQALRRVLIAASTSSVYRTGRRTAEHLWEHALLTALVADELGALAHRPRGSQDFVAGILHDIGRLVLHLTDPRLCERVEDDDASLERTLFGISHAEIGAYVAQKWDLDNAIVEAILTHHRPSDELATRIATAERVADGLARGEDLAGHTSLSLRETELAAVTDLAVARFRTERALFE